MLNLPNFEIPIVPILETSDIKISMKREDLIHPQISGNKYWKLFHNVNTYLHNNKVLPFIITFGGAYSNHIAAVSAFGQLFNIPTLGIIRGEELLDTWKENPTLKLAHENGMSFRFVSREVYRDKNSYTRLLEEEFPNALVIPEGGTNSLAVEGVRMMLNEHTKDFDYLCTAVGTGGTVSGLSKYAEEDQRVLGLNVVRDKSLSSTVFELSQKNNVIWEDASFGGYGKIKEDIVQFINAFKIEHNILLDPVYTGKMMCKVLQLAQENYFPKGANILCFHTGGLQGIAGANIMLQTKNKPRIEV